MKKEKWALRLSITAIILCIITFLCFHTRLEGFLPSTNDFLVTVLAILVTVLITWQIFNVINFENRLAKLKEEALREIEINKDLSRRYMCNAFSNMAGMFYLSEYYDVSLIAFIKAIEMIDLNNELEKINIKNLVERYENKFFNNSSSRNIELIIKNINDLPDDRKIDKLMSIQDHLKNILKLRENK